MGDIASNGLPNIGNIGVGLCLCGIGLMIIVLALKMWRNL